MRIGLVAPLGEHCAINPGSHMITAGIRYLLRQAIPDAVFLPIEMHRDDESWNAAPLCDVLVLCGNPRFSMSEESFWECGIWPKLMGLQNLGIKVIDAWAGACHGWADLTIDEMAAAVMAFPRTAQYMEFAKRADGHITRDPLMQRMYEMAGVPSVMLPCSSWWAASEYQHLENSGPHDCLITVLGIPGDEGMAAAVRAAIASQYDKPRVIASTWTDYQHMLEAGIECELIHDPESLLRAYWQAVSVIAFRLHSAIPAASLGCATCLVAVDSRALAAEPFGIPVIGLDEAIAGSFEFASALDPDEAATVATLRGLLS